MQLAQSLLALQDCFLVFVPHPVGGDGLGSGGVGAGSVGGEGVGSWGAGVGLGPDEEHVAIWHFFP